MASYEYVPTSEKGIYRRKGSKVYDIKYSVKEYDPKTKKNKSKSKWYYGVKDLDEARTIRQRLIDGVMVDKSKEITLEGAYEVWKTKAKLKNMSKITLNNTRQYMNMLYQFFPKDFKMRTFNENIYSDFIDWARNDKHYAEETLHNLNATLRKLFNLCTKKRLLVENPLTFTDNPEIGRKEDYVLVKKFEFDKMDNYLATHKFIRLGINTNRKRRLLLNFLYYTGMRIGEILGLTYNDVFYKDFGEGEEEEEERPIRLVPYDTTEEEHMRCMMVHVDSAYDSLYKEMHDKTKNKKIRDVPIPACLERLFEIDMNIHVNSGGSKDDRIFQYTHSNAKNMINTLMEKCNIDKPITCHSFRHTYISYLIEKKVSLPLISLVSGDTQETILNRYSHLFNEDVRTIIMLFSPKKKKEKE